MNNPICKTETHLVLIADESGIASVFSKLKSQLSDRSAGYLTLVYTRLNNNSKPLFADELQYLEKRFSAMLEIKMIEHEENVALMKSKLKHTLEVLLNCTISNDITFFAGGNYELIEHVKKMLVFLGVRPTQITTEIYTSPL